MKFSELKQAMDWRRRVGFNGGGYVKKKVLPQPKPKEEAEKVNKARKEKTFEKAKPALENPKEVKEMIDKPKRGLVDEPGSYAGKDDQAQKFAMREVKKYINSLPKGTLVTKDLIEKFYKDNNLKGSKDFQHILNKVRGSKDIKSGIKFEESKKVTTRRREFDDLGVKLKKVNPEEPFQFIGKKDDITGITDKRFQREYKLTKNGQNFVDNFNALVDAYDGSFKFTPDRVSIAIKAAGGDPKYRNVLKNKIGAPTSPVRNKLKVAKGNPEKIKNYIKNVVLNPETKWQELEGGSLNKHLAIKFNATNRYIDKVLSTVESPDPEIPQLVKENKRLFNFLNSREFRKKFGTKKSRIQTIGDIQEFAEMRPKGLATYSARSKNPGMFIFDSAFRDFTQAMDAQDAGKNISPTVKFIGDPRVQNPSEWKFVYKNKTFGFNNVEGSLTDRQMSKNALPESARIINDLGTTTEAGKLRYGKIFPEVYAIFEDKATYDSATYKGKQLDWYRRNIKADGTGDEWRRKMPSVEIDHSKGVRGNPFTKLRLLDRDVNSLAGSLFKSYNAGNINKKQYDDGLNKIGYFDEYKGVNNFIANSIKELETNSVKIPKKLPGKGRVIDLAGKIFGVGLGGTGASIAADGTEATSVLPTAAGAGAGAAAVGTKTGRSLLGKAFRTLGTPLSGLGFAGTNVYSKMKEGQSLADAVVDPITGLELSFPGLFKENLSKIISERAASAPGLKGAAAKFGRGLLGLGRIGRLMTPVGLTLAAAGQAQDFYNQYQNLQRMKRDDPEAYQQFLSTRQAPALSAAEQTAIEDMGRFGAAGGGIMKIAGKSSGPPPESGPTSQGLDFLMKRGRQY